MAIPMGWSNSLSLGPLEPHPSRYSALGDGGGSALSLLHAVKSKVPMRRIKMEDKFFMILTIVH